MRTTSRLLFATLLTALIPAAALGGSYDGTVKLGGIYIDETAGDLSAVQETYNLYDGFSVSQILLNARFNTKNYLRLNLHEINLDSRRADVEYRVPGRFQADLRFRQHRQVFDPDRIVTSKRKDWRFGVWGTPVEWAKLSFNYNHVARDRNRMGFPPSTMSGLGTQYDYRLKTGRVEGQFRRSSRVLGVAYDFSNYRDDLASEAERRGQIFSARLFTPSFFLPNNLTHMVRAAYGKHELKDSNLDYKLTNVRYTGKIHYQERYELKYTFYGSRVDNAGTALKTDNFSNDVDLTCRYRYGNVSAGYGYETNDDDRSLTSYNTWRVSTLFKWPKRLKAVVRYSNRRKSDEEKRTLLQEFETFGIMAKIDVRVWEELYVGAKYLTRQRDLFDIGVESEGLKLNSYVRFERPELGSITADYTYGEDDYDNLDGGFNTRSHIVTGRIDTDYIRNLRAAVGASYVDVGADLDIEKSIVFIEAAYRFADDFELEARYNAYNYDDYILVGRYYTANVVWVNLGYNFGYNSGNN